MPALQRSAAPRGARFYQDGGKLMFVNVLDASTRDGPRPATAVDKKAYPEALDAFQVGGADVFPGSRPLVSFDEPKAG